MTGVMWLSGTRTILCMARISSSNRVLRQFVGLLDVSFLQTVEQVIWIAITKSSLYKEFVKNLLYFIDRIRIGKRFVTMH